MTFTKITRFKLYMCQRYQINQLYSKLIAGLLGHMILMAEQRYEYFAQNAQKKEEKGGLTERVNKRPKGHIAHTKNNFNQ